MFFAIHNVGGNRHRSGTICHVIKEYEQMTVIEARQHYYKINYVI